MNIKQILMPNRKKIVITVIFFIVLFLLEFFCIPTPNFTISPTPTIESWNYTCGGLSQFYLGVISFYNSLRMKWFSSILHIFVHVLISYLLAILIIVILLKKEKVKYIYKMPSTRYSR